MKYLKRMVYRPDGTRIPLPTHLFFYITLVFGLAFVAPSNLFSLGTVELFKFSALHGVAVIWGSCLIAVSIMNTIMLLTRSSFLGKITGVFGFCCWTYAAIAYFVLALPLGFLVVAIPNMAFWAWYSTRLGLWSQYLNSRT